MPSGKAQPVSWAQPQIKVVVAHGLMAKSIQTFRPNDPLTPRRPQRARFRPRSRGAGTTSSVEASDTGDDRPALGDGGERRRFPGGTSALPAASRGTTGSNSPGRPTSCWSPGASLNAFQSRYGTLFAPGTRVIRVDNEPDSGTRRSPTTSARTWPVPAGPRRPPPGRLRRRGRGGNLACRGARGGFRRPSGADPVEDPAEFGADGRLNPRAVVAALEHILPAQRSVVMDGGHFIGWAPMYLSVPDPQAMILVGTAFQSIGLGFGSAAGVSAARPERTTVFFSGDGGGLMGLADFETLPAHHAGTALLWCSTTPPTAPSCTSTPRRGCTSRPCSSTRSTSPPSGGPWAPTASRPSRLPSTSPCLRPGWPPTTKGKASTDSIERLARAHQPVSASGLSAASQ